MERLYFGDYTELSDYMIDKAQNNTYVVAVLFRDEAVELIKELMLYRDEMDLGYLHIEPEDCSGYNKEYYVSLAEDFTLAVEPAFEDGIYLDSDADLLLIDANANSAVIGEKPDYKTKEIYIGYNGENCDNYDSKIDTLVANRVFDHAKFIKDEDGNIIGAKVDNEYIFRDFEIML